MNDWSLFPLLKRQIVQHAPTAVSDWQYDSQNHTLAFTCSYVEVKLIVHGFQIYSHIDDIQNVLPRKQIDPLRVEVRQMLDDFALHNRVSAFRILILVLQVLEHVADFEDRYTDAFRKLPTQRRKWHVDEFTDWNSLLENPYGLDPSTIVDTAQGFLGKTPTEICGLIPPQWRVIHIESVIRPDLAHRFLRYRSKVHDGCNDESVVKLRTKLPPHSTTLQKRVRSSIPRTEILDDMVQPRMTFHGTTLPNVRSIVRHGFKLPGALISDSNGGRTRIVSPRSGIAWSDRGIYSSQQPSYALSFAAGQRQKTPLGDIPSMRLFVCATLMGRTCSSETNAFKDIHGPLQEGYDAHFDGAFEYIVHDEAAILPCYVIHLDLGSQEAKRAITEAQESPERFVARHSESARRTHSRLNTEPMAPGDIKREVERKKAAAMKWFPYGFGTATGTQFKILEVGSTSDDDEEEYGEWQEDKHSYVSNGGRNADNDIYDPDDANDDLLWYTEHDEHGNVVRKKKEPVSGAHFLDQYQTARNAGMKRGGCWSDLRTLQIGRIDHVAH